MTSGVAGRVVERGEIWIAGLRYPLAAPVQKSLASQFPQKVVFGDYTAESNPYVSTLTWSDFSGGLGKEVGKFPEDITRFRWGRGAVTEVPGKVFSGPRALNNVLAGSTNESLVDLAISDNVLYATRSDTATTSSSIVMRVIGGANPPATVIRTLAALPTDFQVGMLNDTITLAVATSSGVDYSNGPDDTTWSRNTTPMRYLAFSEGNLFGVNSSGQFFVTPNLGSSWTELAKFQLTSSAITGLVPAPQADGRETVYLASRYGLHAYDKENERFIPTALQFSYSSVAGDAVIEWRGAVYWASGQQIYRLTPGSPSILEQIGPNNGVDGVPLPGSFLAFAKTPLHLYAVFQNNDSALDRRYHSLRWNGNAWHFHGVSLNTFPNTMNAAVAGYANSSHELFIASTSTGAAAHTLYVQQSNTPVDSVNPRRSASQNVYDTDFDHSVSTPWLRSEGDQDWLALHLIVDSIHPSSSDRIDVQYLLNFATDDTNSTSYVTLGTVRTTGIQTFDFPRYLDAEGLPFRAIRLKPVLFSATSTSTPELNRMTLVYRKRLAPQWAFTADIKMDAPYKGRSPKQMRETLEATVGQVLLVEMTYRDQEDGTQNFLVQIVSYNSAETSGHENTSVARIGMTEVVSRNRSAFVRRTDQGLVDVQQLPVDWDRPILR